MPPKPDDEKPDYLKHRERLRDRILERGVESLQDYELLEFLLCLAIPRKDVKPIAKALLKRFGSVHAVIVAEPAALKEINGIGDSSVAAIKAMQGVSLLMKRQLVLDKPILSSWKAVLDYCHAAMAHDQIEQFRLLFLDGKNALIADEVQSRGTVNHAPVYIREVVKRTLAHGAISIIMAHNHPTGDPTPSRDDIDMTRAVQRALAEVGVNVHDHIIIGRSGHSSLRSLGLMDAAKAAR